MRLQLLTILLLFALLVLAACSSMEVSSASESFGNQVPTDFDWHEFDRLNPEIRLAQVTDYFNTLNVEWSDRVQDEENIGMSTVTSKYMTPYRTTSLYIDSSDIGINIDSSGIGIQIAKNYLKWTDEMIYEIGSDQRTYLYRFLLYGRKEEEITVIDSLMSIVDRDSTIFYKNYIHYKSQGRAYRVCQESEKRAEKERSGIPNAKYGDYEFCADTTTEPHTVYAIQ